MDDLSRAEYPAMLGHLQPQQAVTTFQERVKRINRINQEIAEWLQERRKVEEQYVAGLKRLMTHRVPSATTDLGIFQTPWAKVLASVNAIAMSHHLYAQRLESDVEASLRNFHNKKEMQNANNMAGNLQVLAKELDEAQAKSDKLTKKAGKASAAKVDAATSQLESATQQWESQAPFIYETLQALDEQRINHLRDLLTQLETHEVDQATRTQAAAEDALNTMLEISTATEILSFSTQVTSGRPKIEKRSTTRQSSVAGGSTLAPPSIRSHDDNASEHSARNEPPAPESGKLRSRIGTMLGRRRQSVHGGFGPLSPSKGSGPFGRSLGSSHGRSISPRASSHNLSETHGRLSSLAETPDSPKGTSAEEGTPKESQEGTNGHALGSSKDTPHPRTVVNGTTTAEDIFDAPPPAGPPPSHQKMEGSSEPTKDAEGFTVPAAFNDPISQAQKEAAETGEERDQLFSLNIKNEPVAEEDADAKKAALSNVANTLSMAMPSRKTGTVRGRRDVRNTIYVPSVPTPETSSESPFPIPSPSLSSSISRPPAVAALQSEASIAGTSDTQSVRSATSLGSLVHLKHPDLHNPGLSSSIIETVSATFSREGLVSAKVSGEIAFAYNATDDTPSKGTPIALLIYLVMICNNADYTTPDRETIRINNFPRLEVIGPNRIFVQNTPAPDEFVLDVSHLQKTSIGFNYRVHADSDTALGRHCPIAFFPTWKPQGDKLGLLLQYRLADPSSFRQPVTLHNVAFVAFYEGARASAVQSKPSGTHLRDKQLVYWRMPELTLTEDWAKIVCRFVAPVGEQALPGRVEARWEYAVPAGEGAGVGISVSRLVESKGKGKASAADDDDDPFADESATPRTAEGGAGSWVEVPLVKKLVSGRYEVK
ncbi:uncharacterized protein E0L32_000309 [Thyridium curvatum]|uniref:Uncharacterized protein n=1 Tax=Thyridium curvatum TaxID=1093900 RepID=A0A507AYS9_9PEZI|nr:uncharacterized protein E0L32_000309 [Thyridium curvatum]TPX15975.1 hypothetical protein E0L32_000309 [Thyridium curvatum]